MSDAEFQVPIEYVSKVQKVTVEFDETKMDTDEYLNYIQLKQEYKYEQFLKNQLWI